MTIQDLVELGKFAQVVKNAGMSLIEEDAPVSLDFAADQICVSEPEYEDEELYVLDKNGEVQNATLADVMADATLHTYFWTGSPYKKDNIVVADYSNEFEIDPLEDDIFNSSFMLDTFFNKLGIEMGDDLGTPAGQLFEAWADADDDDEKYEIIKKVIELPQIATLINQIAA